MVELTVDDAEYLSEFVQDPHAQVEIWDLCDEIKGLKEKQEIDHRMNRIRLLLTLNGVML